MEEKGGAIGGSVNRPGPGGAIDRKVGRIVLNGRHFAVLLSADLQGERGAKVQCRFDLAGECLSIVETVDPDSAQPDATIEELATRLTGRELEIAALVAQGHANKNIAYRLQISEWTVATYLRRIFLKLDVESRAAMVFRCAPLLKTTLQARSLPEGLPAKQSRTHRS